MATIRGAHSAEHAHTEVRQGAQGAVRTCEVRTQGVAPWSRGDGGEWCDMVFTMSGSIFLGG